MRSIRGLTQTVEYFERPKLSP